MDSLLSRRETFGVFKPFFPNESSMVERLGNTETLESHAGCVNTLRWNEKGSLLISGSDDRMLKLWSVDGTLIKTVNTGHRGIIFAAEFVPCGEDRIIASGAGDHLVKLHDINSDEVLNTWSCKGRVKRMATAQDEPYLFWSSSEDGNIRQYDVRTNNEEEIIQTGAVPIKSFAVCQGRTELIAVGSEEHFTPLYDRRQLSKPFMTLASADAVINRSSRITFTTHVAFNYMGTEVIVNQGCGPIYVYNLENREPTVLQRLESILTTPVPVTYRYSDHRAPVLDNVRALFTEKNYNKVIEYISQALAESLYSDMVEKSALLCLRGKSFLSRRWPGDTYAAARDFIEAVRINPAHCRALWWLVRALLLLEQYKLASRCIDLYKERFKDLTAPSITTLENQVNIGLTEQIPENYEEMVDDPQYLDYHQRFTGHTNCRTDIKEANFFGSRDQFIVSGSDSGSLYIWDRDTGNIKVAFYADEEILNIVQPHPSKFMLATSGIENVIRFWEPLPEGQYDLRRVDNVHELNRFNSPQFAFLGNIAATGVRLAAGEMEGSCRVV
ncbi:unnamed protein product [Auanema sp. JU1783]|nr:unnamed protein product [Auanema sp. JU1783]